MFIMTYRLDVLRHVNLTVIVSYPYENIVFLITMKRVAALILLLSIIASCTKKTPVVIIETKFGNIHIELYADKAPITSENFMRYVDDQRYVGSTFYRVVKANNQPNSDVKIEVIQGGLYEDNHPQNLPPIAHENTKTTGILHTDGVISMARYGPGTATFEFFICVGNQPSLDFGGSRNSDNHGFAAFGKVIQGMDIVRIIHNQPEHEQYLEPRIPIINMEVIR